MKLYISGPMTGYRDYNRETFYAAEEFLTEYGYEVFNPAWLSEGEAEPSMPYQWYLRQSLLRLISDDIQGIAVLPGWHFSLGASTEVTIGEALELPIRSVDAWVDLLA